MMRSLLLVIILAALSACDEVNQELHQVQAEVYVLGSEESGESLIILQPEGDGETIITSRPEGNGPPCVFTISPEWSRPPFVITPRPEGDAIIIRPEGCEQPIDTSRPEGNAEPIVTSRAEMDRESKILLELGQDEEAKGDVRSNNISQGNIGLWDIMLAHYNPLRQAVANQVIVMDINYQGVALGRISFIRAIQTSGQLATARILAGGLGMNFVIIRLTSARGSGFQYSIDIWGR